MRRFDGEYRWFLFRVAPAYDSTRNLVGWLGVDLGTNEHKRSQDQLQRSESYLAAAQKLSHTGSFGWNVSTSELYWSEETSRIFGCERETTPTLDLVLERVHPEDTLRVKQTLEQALGDQKDFDFEHRLLMPNGAVKHVRVVGQSSEDRSEFVGVVMDITPAKQVEDALRASELNFRTIVESIPGMVVTLTAKGEVEFANQPLLRFFGKTLEELRDWSILVHPDDRERVVTTVLRSLETGDPYEFEHRVLRADGVYRWCHSCGHPLRDNDGRITR
jgi:PAS domain S-box-containing protein